MSSLIGDLPVNGPATQAGLSCRHDQCQAVFSDLDDATTHANDCHDGQLVVDTCVIREVRNAVGEIELVLVADSECVEHSSAQQSTGATGSPTILVPATQSAVQVASVSSMPVPTVEQSNTTSRTTPVPSAGASIADADTTMRCILQLAGELDGQCRACWVNGDVGRMHYTYRCDTGICSGTGWRLFKAKTTFPPGLACFLCFATYGPPFNHEVPQTGSKYKGELCDYPDLLKELAYVLFHSEVRRNAIFARLRHSAPATIISYWRFIRKKQASGLLGVYEVLAAFLDLKEAGDL